MTSKEFERALLRKIDKLLSKLEVLIQELRRINSQRQKCGV